MDTPLKRCTKCSRELPRTTEYFYRNPRVKGGLASACKDCNNARVKAWEQANLERYAAIQQRSQARRKAERAAYQRRYRAQRKTRDAGDG